MESTERRASTRRPIKLAAQLQLSPDQQVPCQIADFCAEGMFIRLSANVDEKLKDQHAKLLNSDLTVRFRSPEVGGQYEARVRPVRVTEGAMGVAFTELPQATLDALFRLCGAGPEQTPSTLKPKDDQAEFVLRQCARLVIQQVEPLMQGFYRQVDAALAEAAQHASSDTQANELMDARGEISSRQRPVWLAMQRQLESPLKPRSQGTASAELSLVDKTEFEDWLTIKVMVTKADTLFRGELLQLRMRLDKLGVSNRTGHHNPLGPALICEAFHAGMHPLALSRLAEKTAFKVFEQTVVRELEPLYRALNQLLIRHGILPTLDLSKYLSERQRESAGASAKQAVSPAPKPSMTPPVRPTLGAEPRQALPPEVPSPARARPGGAENSFRFQSMQAQSAFATVKNLLGTLAEQRAAHGDAPTSGFSPNARPISAGEFQRELQRLQVQVANSGDLPETPLRERVVSRIAQDSDQALTPEQQESLDVVDQFFRSIADSPRLGAVAREQLRRLEIPVLKVVMRDPGFFDDADSPLRGVMNRLAQLGVKGGRSNPVVERRVNELIQKVATDFEQDTRVFESVQNELDSLIERQNLVYRRNAERVMAAAEGAQKVTDSKGQVARVLDEKLAGREVPKAVISLLEGGWRDLLSLTWIRQGPDSQLWQDYLSVIDSLLTFADDANSLINMPELLRMIQDGLASISSNHMPSAQIREELKRFLVRRPEDAVERVVAPRFAEAEPDTRPQAGSTGLHLWIGRAQRLRTGDWLRYEERAGEASYIRLVWIARAFSRFVFVNHQGMRVVELELEQLARHMQRGTIRPDSTYERPLVDESIDRMVRQVYDQLSWAVTHDETTGLLNRREFERVLEQQLSRHEDELSLVYLDLRQFRILNDTAGFESGDNALRVVADILRAEVGEQAPLARLSGNEFAFLLPAEQAESGAKAIIHGIESREQVFSGRRYQLSANAGIAPPLPSLVTAERWMKAADQACKMAKYHGNGRVEVYALDDRGRAQQEQIAAKVAGLGNLDEERVLLRCQKILPLHAKARLSTQYEILISMYDDSGGLITAAEFVRMAERYNRMQAVDRWVVGHMLDWLRDRKVDSQRMGGVCINLSGHSLNEDSLLEFIYDKLSEKDAPIERLWFEITEAAAIHNLQSVAEFIEEMKELGCRFCLGNFGNGQASYHYMRNLPVDMVKLDGAFTANLVSSETDQAIVRSMVDMAHYLQREVIASQVESREVLDALCSLGVDYAQGYVIEKPRLLSTLDEELWVR